MQVLEYIEAKFDSFTLLIKIELFLLPLILFIIANSFEEKTERSDKNIFFKSLELNNLKMKTKLVDILKDIEDFIVSKDIELLDISNKKDEIKISIKTKKQYKLIEVLKYIEDYNEYSKIVSIKSNKDIKELTIRFNKFYIKKDIKLDYSLLLKSSKTVKNENILLRAIIGNKVLINDLWLTLGDKVSKYKIVKIDKNSVYLEDGIQLIKLDIFDEKYF